MIQSYSDNYKAYNIAEDAFTERIHIRALSFPIINQTTGIVIPGIMETRIVRPDDIKYAQSIPCTYDIMLYKDSDYLDNILYEDSDGNAYDLSGCTITAYAYCADNEKWHFDIHTSITSASTGAFKMYLSANEVNAISMTQDYNGYVTTKYNYYVTLTTASNKKMRIIQGVAVISV